MLELQVTVLMVPSPLEIIEIDALVCKDATMSSLHRFLGVHPIIFNVGSVNSSVWIHVVSFMTDSAMGVVVDRS